MLVVAMGWTSSGQEVPGTQWVATTANASSGAGADLAKAALTRISPAVEQLLAFRESDVKFKLNSLMDVLSDRRHEGWVLAAYPDPKTRQPLIGAGVSLDLPAREHAQRDPLNPHMFLEPSSAEMWQAAGLETARLNAILTDFYKQAGTWTKRNRREKIRGLEPQITDEDATHLLRVAAIQSVINAKAYCRNFDEMSASQQMALSQLVFQMGVNLEEFNTFLGVINHANFGTAKSVAAGTGVGEEVGKLAAQDELDWKSAQKSLVESQWARLYRTRAVAVIAMLNPDYEDNPAIAERQVGATLRPVAVHRGRGRARAVRTTASAGRSLHHGPAGKRDGAHKKRRV